MSRINEIFCAISPAKSIADVGCDHGLVSKLILENGLTKNLIFTDISDKCLNKARELLSDYVDTGLAKGYRTDGLKGVDGAVSEVVICGMGGEEIIKILEESVRRLSIERVVLQPMKNSKEVRRFLIENGFVIGLDYTFFKQDKYYDLITAVKLTDNIKDFYTDLEYEFGRQNLKIRPKDFLSKLENDIESVKSWSSTENLTEKSKSELHRRLELLEKIYAHRY